MHHGRTFKFSIYLTLFAGILAIVSAEEEVSYLLLFLVASVLSWFLVDKREVSYLPEGPANFLIVVCLGFFLFDHYRVGRELSESVEHLLLLVCIIKLFQRKSIGNLTQIYVLSFLLVINSAAITNNLSFLIVLLYYLAISTFSLSLFFIQRQVHESGLEPMHEGFWPTSEKALDVFWSRKYFNFTLLMSLLTIAVSFGFFLVIPRFHRLDAIGDSTGDSLVSNENPEEDDSGKGTDETGTEIPTGPSPSGVTGISSFIDYNDPGGFRLRESNNKVMTCEFSRNGAAWAPENMNLYFRSLVFTTYKLDGGKEGWEPRSGATAAKIASGNWEAVPGAGLKTLPNANLWTRQNITMHLASPDKAAQGNLWLPHAGMPCEWDLGSISGTFFRADNTIRLLSLPTPFPKDGFSFVVESDLSQPFEEDLAKAVIYRFPSDAQEKWLLTSLPDGVDRDSRFEDEILNKLDLKGKTDFEKVRAIEAFLQSDKFTYTLRRPALSRGETTMTEFLFVSHRGYCEQFAGAMALLLRKLDIPCRLAGGFRLFTEKNDGKIEVVAKNAHVWVEVPFENFGWVRFDPTPGENRFTINPDPIKNPIGNPDNPEDQPKEIVKPDVKEIDKLDMPLDDMLVKGIDSKTQGHMFAYTWQETRKVMQWLLSLLGRFWKWTVNFNIYNYGKWLFLILIPVVLLGVWRMLPSRKRARNEYHKHMQETGRKGDAPKILRFYNEFLKLMFNSGFRRKKNQTPLEFAEYILSKNKNLPGVWEITSLYCEARYGGKVLHRSDLKQTKEWLKQIFQQTKKLEEAKQSQKELPRQI